MIMRYSFIILSYVLRLLCNKNVSTYRPSFSMNKTVIKVLRMRSRNVVYCTACGVGIHREENELTG